MSINSWMDTHITSIPWTDNSCKSIILKFDAKLKKSDSKGYTWYDSIYMRENRSVIESGEGIDYRETQGNLSGWWKICILIMLYIFVKTHRTKY